MLFPKTLNVHFFLLFCLSVFLYYCNDAVNRNIENSI